MGLRLSVQASPMRSRGFCAGSFAAVAMVLGHGAPSSIQLRNTAMSFVVSFSFGGISKSFLECITA
jgi:hypothetical protein